MTGGEPGWCSPHVGMFILKAAHGLQPSFQVGLMDRLLMYYLLWLDGHTIVQTCYSCLYLQDPPRLLTLGQRMAKAFFPRPLGVAHVAASGGRGRRRRRPVVRCVFDDAVC